MYKAKPERYADMKYISCGKSGLKLPAVSLGLWHTYGEATPYATARELTLRSFDAGITHFDIANNYGPPPGSAETTFGKILKDDLMPYRDELIIASKAGYRMWDGPYGDMGSRKYIIASADQSLKRCGLEYFDIFYHHRPDSQTPIEETIDALKHLVDRGKALYAGISNYNAEQTKAALEAAKAVGLKILIHQVNYSMFNRGAEADLFRVLDEYGVGAIAYSPLAQGQLSDKYFNGIPVNSRAGGVSHFLNPDAVTPEKVEKAKKLNVIAGRRGQTLSQMALAWVMRNNCVASVLAGASNFGQMDENAGFIQNLEFDAGELAEIEAILL